MTADVDYDAEFYDAPDDYEPEPAPPVRPDDWWSREAEVAVLGAMLVARDATAIASEIVQDSHFRHPAHAAVFRAITRVYDEGATPDALAVAVDLQRHPDELALIGGNVQVLVELQASAPYIGNTARYASEVRGFALRREHREAANRFLTDDVLTADPMTVGERARDRHDQVDARFAGIHTGPRGLRAFRDQDLSSQKVDAIDGLLRVGQVAVVTGTAGHGKSLLGLQVALSLACGQHPLTHLPHPRKRVLYVQCENDAAEEQDRIESMLTGRNGTLVDEDAFDIHVRPEGVDLTSAEGRAWLRSLVRTWRPDLLAIGPYKNLHVDQVPGRAADGYSALAAAVQKPLNDLRKEYGTAVWLEAHPTNDVTPGSTNPLDFKPSGGARMSNWSSLGLCLMPREEDDLYQIGAWREPRRPQTTLPRLMVRRSGTGWPWWPADANRGD